MGVYLSKYRFMQKLTFILVVSLFFAACVHDPVKQADALGLQLVTEANPEWQYENLRLFPVLADADLTAANESLRHFHTLAEAMQTTGFRITERKKFGREEAWYSGLTVQNRSQDTIFILSGDVITGGNQDRVFAHHEVILPASIKNAEVFCVERGRSFYYDSTASETEKKVAAFKGYYNVASPEVRRAIQSSGDQHQVWAAVERVTLANNAGSSTDAYAGLEQGNADKTKRDACLQFFQGKLIDRPNVVGMVAVCGESVIGVDIFGHPDLFQRQYNALLHGYVAELALKGKGASISEKAALDAFAVVSAHAAPAVKDSKQAGKFAYDGRWVHLFRK